MTNATTPSEMLTSRDNVQAYAGGSTTDQEMTMTTLTPRQVRDFRNGYAHGYHEARHGETSVEGTSVSPEHAEGVRRGLVDGAAHGPGVGIFAGDVERAVARFATEAAAQR